MEIQTWFYMYFLYMNTAAILIFPVVQMNEDRQWYELRDDIFKNVIYQRGLNELF